jgi:sulfite dehydrogenase (cytochrome) subunit A
MGNARWRGIPLSAILEKAGVQTGARQVAFNGLDGPPLPETPDFAKALDLSHAGDGEVMVAYAMNGEGLPWLNGYPLRLVVPGYYGTYWVKHLSEIVVLDEPFDGYWMSKAYRIPDNDCACTPPGKPAAATTPIKRLATRSFITNLADGAEVRAGAKTALRGIAFDGGQGIGAVLVSADGGKNWTQTQLGENLGRYSFREWRTELFLPAGVHELKTLAIAGAGRSQPLEPLWNPPGYMRNVVETVRVQAI